MNENANRPNTFLVGRLTTGACVAMAVLTASPSFAAERPIPEFRIEGERNYDSPDNFRRVVSFADLDLGTTDGVRALTKRIRAAARDGCNRLYHGEAPYATLHQRGACIRSSVRDAMPQVERVTRLAMNGDPTATQVAIVVAE